jgi:hypothetical protein
MESKTVTRPRLNKTQEINFRDDPFLYNKPLIHFIISLYELRLIFKAFIILRLQKDMKNSSGLG